MTQKKIIIVIKTDIACHFFCLEASKITKRGFKSVIK